MANTPEVITKTVEADISTSIMSRGSLDKDEGDDSGSYHASLSITYSKYTDSVSGDEMYLLQNYSGRRTQEDSHVSISNKGVAYGCNGAHPNVSGQNREFSVSGMSFSGHTGFTKYIADAYNGNICRTAMSATLKRAGSSHTWNFFLDDNIVNNGYTWPFW